MPVDPVTLQNDETLQRINLSESSLCVCRFTGAKYERVRQGPAFSAEETACGKLVSQHLQVNNFFPHLCKKKPSLTEPLIPLTHPPSLQTDLLWAKILCFSIETCPLRGDIDVFFLAGVMIWWIRISKRGDNTRIVCFCVCFSVGFCLCVQILISQMNTNI